MSSDHISPVCLLLALPPPSGKGRAEGAKRVQVPGLWAEAARKPGSECSQFSRVGSHKRVGRNTPTCSKCSGAPSRQGVPPEHGLVVLPPGNGGVLCPGSHCSGQPMTSPSYWGVGSGIWGEGSQGHCSLFRLAELRWSRQNNSLSDTEDPTWLPGELCACLWSRGPTHGDPPLLTLKGSRTPLPREWEGCGPCCGLGDGSHWAMGVR